MFGRSLRFQLRGLDPGVGLLAVAAAFGLLTALLMLGYLRGRDSGAAAISSPVVQLKTDIKAGESITASAIELVTVPLESVEPGAVTTTASAIGQVARFPLSAGEQVVASRLVDRKGEDALAFTVPEGLRAVSVPFSAVMGAGGLVVPGDRVDVLVFTEYASLFGPGEVVPQAVADHPAVVTLLQNVLVLALDRTVGPGTETGTVGRLSTRDTPDQAKTVTVAASLEDAQLLFLATQRGTLGLAVRRFGDESQTAVSPEFKMRSTLAPLVLPTVAPTAAATATARAAAPTGASGLGTGAGTGGVTSTGTGATTN
ncbi:MAG: Flp pilus assembly protein CpaB [Dehalococcoidia bacterium]|nr:Flp pilus assembly protein CpaB [Dehalococcoidia bacterium]